MDGTLGSGNGNGGGSGKGKDKGNGFANSFSGSKVVEEKYADLGISNVVMVNDKGENVLNTDGINQTVNNQVRKIENPDTKEMRQFLQEDTWYNGTDLWHGANRSDIINSALDKFKFPKDRMTGRSSDTLTDNEKILLRYTIAKTQKLGYFGTVDTADILRILSNAKSGNHDEAATYINNVATAITNDTGLKRGDVIFQHGWHRGEMSKYFSEVDLAAAMEAEREYTKKAFGLGGVSGKNDGARNRSNPNIRHGAPSGIAKPQVGSGNRYLNTFPQVSSATNKVKNNQRVPHNIPK